MLLNELNQFIQGVNITILPIIIIPVSGLCCLVFYNRLAAVNSWVHAMQKELRGLLVKEKQARSPREMELMIILQMGQKKLLERSHLVRCAIVCCFSGIIAFILSAISIMLSIFQPAIVMVTLILWSAGAFLFAIGLIMGMIEVKSSSLSNIMLETDLIEKWLEQEK